MSTKKLNAHKKGYDHYVTTGGMYLPKQKMPITGKIEPGIYDAFVAPDGTFVIKPLSAVTDGLVDLPDHISDTVLKDLNKFWQEDTRKRFDKFSVVYKRGVLMYGPPGTGKTVITNKVMERVVNEGGIVFFDTSPQLLYQAVEMIREIQGDIKILAVYEEFDAWLDDSKFLSLLDGELQIENIVYLATTNYIERIPPRIKNRPSRFASVVEVGFPNASVRRAFFTAKVGADEPSVNIDEWVEKTDGFTLDHMKDLIISVLCIETPLDDAIAKLRVMNADDLREDDEEGFALGENPYQRIRDLENALSYMSNMAAVAPSATMTVAPSVGFRNNDGN